MAPLATLDKLLDKGLVADIFRAERALALLETIGTNASKLNSTKSGNFGDLFGAFQASLTSECVLATARLFDRPNQRYPMRCVRYVLDRLRAQAETLPSIGEPYQLEISLRAAGLKSLVKPMQTDAKTFAAALVNHFEGILADAQTVETLDRLRTLRDKAIAHNEHVESVVGPTWAALRVLLGHAKTLVGILGWAWLQTAYDMNGTFTTTEDAMRPSWALERLIERLNPAPA
jgi:hypothetical protein